MCWQGCGKVQDWGASSGCCGLFHFATWSFFQPQKHLVFLQLLLWFIGLVNVLASSESAEQLVEPFPTIWATMKGNGKYRVILWEHAIADFQFDETDAADANRGQTSSSMKAGDRRSLGHCVQEICSRRNSICCPSLWLQKHVGETCAIDLFTLPSDLPKVDYRKLPVNPKMQSQNTRLEGAPLLPLKLIQDMRRWEHQSGPATTASWTDFCFHKSQTITVHPRTEGWPKGPRLNWDEHLNSQRLARSQHSS